MNLKFKKLKRKDISRLRNLFNSLFIIQKKNNFFLWQSFNYYLKDFFILGAFKNKNLIGTFGLQKKNDNKFKNIYMAHWPAVDKKYHSKGVFSKLVSLALKKKKIDFLYNFFPKTNFSSIKKILSLKSKKIKEFQIEIKNYDQRPNKIKYKILKDFSRVHTNNSIKKEFKSFDYNYNYRKWRYKKHPTYKYYIFFVSKTEFLIFKKFINKKIYIDILEISFNLKNSQKYKKIIISFLNYIKECYKSSIVNLWPIEDKNFIFFLKNCGFKNINSRHIFGYKDFNDLILKKKWIVQKTDSQKF